jgi:hypothetical protein
MDETKKKHKCSQQKKDQKKTQMQVGKKKGPKVGMRSFQSRELQYKHSTFEIYETAILYV